MELSELEQSKSKLVLVKYTHKMTFRNAKIEVVLPMFTGVVGSLICCALLVFFSNIMPLPAAGIAESEIENTENTGRLFLSVTENIPDIVLEYFRNPDFEEWVIDFFAGISNRDVALAILTYSDYFDVPPALAFALSWEESRFNHRAVNRLNRNGSVDRGLFQLNDQSFPHLELASFFDIKTNARYGIGYLRQCLNRGGTVVSALAMYNAGVGRVTSGGTPKVTLNYISRILNNQNKIETLFHTMLIKEEERRMAMIEKKPETTNHAQFSRTLRVTSRF